MIVYVRYSTGFERSTDMTKEEKIKAIKADRRILKRIHGSLNDIPLWEIQALTQEYPDMTKEIYKLFNR